ncbi:MAG: Asp-tRNA(Asn)/Glu-tRNA(Gln) amidotransferase subunit GatB [Phycisphaeraceae bacterium]|nr:Asp-tRNA(Asn)/Glu-tRNA(Gln) amidotransferase subunit GatB [Phycisphaeraceae bacterium]MCB9847137.1 Asp-tRNA(Asn)/Glu-tRNA(Gln) amidotransferase subunit GatB [Phycisphaeraceae bacterium]
MADIVATRLMVGLEIHVELATRSKMFTRVGSPACAEFDGSAPNTLIDPVVLGLPGALPVMNRAAVEMSMLVGMALGCEIASYTKWDRKSYYYPDLPKAYQISQYDLPLCFDGAFDLPLEDGTTKRIGIIRAHLEEDAGKLLHEMPGGMRADFSIVDYNRAGTPLLEIVTAPDFGSADEVVAFARTLRNVCRFLGVTEGVMQKGHMRFEPNINVEMTLDDGHVVKTPIVEIKNLNSFRAVKGAVEFEERHQPARWQEDGKVMGPGAKTTRGWNDAENRTFVQREKEDAHDYRYFPDPDLAPVVVDAAWRDAVRSRLPELPHERAARYRDECGLSEKESLVLTEERDVCFFFEDVVEAAIESGTPTPAAWKQSANMVLQSGARRANERGVLTNELGITPAQVAGIIALRQADEIGSSAADDLFGILCESEAEARAEAERHNLLQVRDEGAMQAWVDAALGDPANAKVVEDIRGGKMSAIGRLIGAVMKASGGQADAKLAQAKIKETLGV